MENNNNIAVAHWGKTISEARTYEEYKGAGVFADLLTDRTFKKAFNPDTKNKVCLIALLNAVLEGEISSPIVDVQSRDKEFNDGSNENRTTVFDLYCIDSAQRRFIIEVQLLMQENIVNRAIYYASQTVIAQGERGQKYNYELKPVVTVVFMEFNVFVDDRYKNMTQMPKQYANTAFELLFSSAYLAKLSKEEQKMIDEAQKAKWDEYAINKAALDRGQNMARHEMAKKMLAEGDSVEKVARISELSEADVLAIKAEIDQK